MTQKIDLAADCHAPRDEEMGYVNGVAGADALRAIIRFVDGGFTESDSAILRRGLDTWLNASGALSVERCLRLPSTSNRMRILRRDHWLCKAALLLDADGSTTGAQKLEAEWNKFLSRGPWSTWRDDEEPPLEATALSKALFWATRFNRSESLTARHIARVAGHIFTEKCR